MFLLVDSQQVMGWWNNRPRRHASSAWPLSECHHECTHSRYPVRRLPHVVLLHHNRPLIVSPYLISDSIGPSPDFYAGQIFLALNEFNSFGSSFARLRIPASPRNYCIPARKYTLVFSMQFILITNFQDSSHTLPSLFPPFVASFLGMNFCIYTCISFRYGILFQHSACPQVLFFHSCAVLDSSLIRPQPRNCILALGGNGQLNFSLFKNFQNYSQFERNSGKTGNFMELKLFGKFCPTFSLFSLLFYFYLSSSPEFHGKRDFLRLASSLIFIRFLKVNCHYLFTWVCSPLIYLENILDISEF